MPVGIRVEPILPTPQTLPLAKLAKVQTALIAAMEGTAQASMIVTLRSYTAKWRHKPSFKGRLTVNNGAGSITLTVMPAGAAKNIWVYVSAGVRPRRIVVVRAKRLRVRKNYFAHTQPGGVVGGPGRYAGPTTYPKEVPRWPGIVARRFEVDAAAHLKDPLTSLLVDVVKAALA